MKLGDLVGVKVIVRVGVAVVAVKFAHPNNCISVSQGFHCG